MMNSSASAVSPARRISAIACRGARRQCFATVSLNRRCLARRFRSARATTRCDIAHIASVHFDRAAGHIVKARDQVSESGFAAAAGPASATTSPASPRGEARRCGNRQGRPDSGMKCFRKRCSAEAAELGRVRLLGNLFGMVQMLKTFCDAPSACSNMLWMPTRRLPVHRASNKAITKLVKSPAVSVPVLIACARK